MGLRQVFSFCKEEENKEFSVLSIFFFCWVFLSIFECFWVFFECFLSVLNPFWCGRGIIWTPFTKKITHSRDSDELFQLLAHFVSIILKKNYTTRQTKSIFLCNHAVSIYFVVALAIFDRYGWIYCHSIDLCLISWPTYHTYEKKKKKNFFSTYLCVNECVL